MKLIIMGSFMQYKRIEFDIECLNVVPRAYWVRFFKINVILLFVAIASNIGLPQLCLADTHIICKKNFIRSFRIDDGFDHYPFGDHNTDYCQLNDKDIPLDISKTIEEIGTLNSKIAQYFGQDPELLFGEQLKIRFFVSEIYLDYYADYPQVSLSHFKDWSWKGNQFNPIAYTHELVHFIQGSPKMTGIFGSKRASWLSSISPLLFEGIPDLVMLALHDQMPDVSHGFPQSLTTTFRGKLTSLRRGFIGPQKDFETWSLFFTQLEALKSNLENTSSYVQKHYQAQTQSIAEAHLPTSDDKRQFRPEHCFKPLTSHPQNQARIFDRDVCNPYLLGTALNGFLISFRKAIGSDKFDLLFRENLHRIKEYGTIQEKMICKIGKNTNEPLFFTVDRWFKTFIKNWEDLIREESDFKVRLAYWKLWEEYHLGAAMEFDQLYHERDVALSELFEFLQTKSIWYKLWSRFSLQSGKVQCHSETFKVKDVSSHSRRESAQF